MQFLLNIEEDSFLTKGSPFLLISKINYGNIMNNLANEGNIVKHLQLRFFMFHALVFQLLPSYILVMNSPTQTNNEMDTVNR